MTTTGISPAKPFRGTMLEEEERTAPQQLSLLERKRADLFEDFSDALQKAKETKASFDLARVGSVFEELQNCNERLMERESKEWETDTNMEQQAAAKNLSVSFSPSS